MTVKWTPSEMAIVNRAAMLYGEANRSDPFAANRIRLYMRQGYVLPSEVIEEATKQIAVRQNAIGAEPTSVES